MCGIAGIVSLGGAVEAQRLRAMTDVLAHRGPDGDGFHLEGRVGLGHRRLAIIDLQTGAQPMGSDDGAVWITYNGELYNFRELRSELQAKGFVFRTSSDTEVVLKSYEAFGVECLAHLRGMFALAIWDRRQSRLVLARDHVGIKPLVYAWNGSELLFASEVKGILAGGTVPRDLDWEALNEYLTFQYVPSPRTIFRAIRKVPPASYLVLDAETGKVTVNRYWRLQFAPAAGRSEADWSAELLAHLEDAVRSHLVSDVPVGAFLSGGMDSGAVVAMMARSGARPIRTFSIGFDDHDFDELEYARQVAARFGTEHHELVVKPDAMEVVPRLAWQFDEPFADSSALPTYYVSKMTREHVTVALSGDGGDENFAGYRRYVTAARLRERLDRFPGRIAKPIMALAARGLPANARGRGYLELLASGAVERYFRMVTDQRRPPLTAMLTPEAQKHLGERIDGERFRRLATASGAPDYVATLQAIDIETYLPEDILTKVDRASMLVSLEARVPLLDRPLMEFLATMPSTLKLRDGLGKQVLRDVMAGLLPGAVVTRSKMGFAVPLGRWFRSELNDYTRDLLLCTTARARGILDPGAVERLLAEHESGGRDLSSQIWTLLCLEQWSRQWGSA